MSLVFHVVLFFFFCKLVLVFLGQFRFTSVFWYDICLAQIFKTDVFRVVDLSWCC